MTKKKKKKRKEKILRLIRARKRIISSLKNVIIFQIKLLFLYKKKKRKDINVVSRGALLSFSNNNLSFKSWESINIICSFLFFIIILLSTTVFFWIISDSISPKNWPIRKKGRFIFLNLKQKVGDEGVCSPSFCGIEDYNSWKRGDTGR